MLVQQHVRNHLLASLPAADFALLAERLEPWRDQHGSVFIKSDSPAPFIYFLNSGVVSIVIHSPNGHHAEIGLIGREGFVHPVLTLGSDHLVWDAQVQIVGDGYRIPREQFLEAMDASASLRKATQKFTYALMLQTCSTALANAVHLTEQRLARWLLMCHDRTDGDELFLTHEFMSVMLSVRRPSTTNALHILEGHRLIRSGRGVVEIRNRAALQAYAADAYGKPEAEYRRLLEAC